ncbi:GNAT family N-acetyltransferase [Paramicrobacterium agarici]|uniref:GNAT family N-acetyltransferase n=1 Tax=Paramicrobacterium agarici TaxID=630514 RepID=UPI00115473AD|nr:GNAT family N-acetyltransferase [Microbacterium agarici]TQO23064.1 RimJ/RimL family protein N-acetyltransferase [Microbacterium agarici]
MTETFANTALPVQTERLTLRKATEADTEAVRSYRQHPDVSMWMPSDGLDADEFRSRFCDPPKLDGKLVIERDGAIIGDIMVAIADGWAQDEVRERAQNVQAELGWCLAPSAQGRGFALEAMTEVLRICFADLGLRRVTAGCFADNEPSWRLMERLHMRRENHTVRESLHRTLGWLDGFEYALLADEWVGRNATTDPQ